MPIFPVSVFPRQSVLQLAQPPHVAYEHLDWVPQRERWFEETTLVEGEAEKLCAMINLTPETADFAWLRFFYSLQDGNHQSYFHSLLSSGCEQLRLNGIEALFSLCQYGWFETMLRQNFFTKTSDIVSLFTDSPERQSAAPNQSAADISLISAEELPEISRLDHECFDQPWQMNQISLAACLKTADYATCLRLEGQIAAYQISHALLDQVHIGRLAVSPTKQHLGLASLLLADLLSHYAELGGCNFSVNTQSDNQASLSLYQKFGFRLTSHSFPVYKLSLF